MSYFVYNKKGQQVGQFFSAHGFERYMRHCCGDLWRMIVASAGMKDPDLYVTPQEISIEEFEKWKQEVQIECK